MINKESVSTMDTTGQILSGLFGVAIVLMIAPNVIRLNRGKMLQNIALWLAIFLGLALAYKTVGPGKNPSLATPIEAESDAPKPLANEGAGTQSYGVDEEGFSPPRE